jgi:uncharacterized protein (PEP-CTERM system associated)
MVITGMTTRPSAPRANALENADMRGAAEGRRSVGGSIVARALICGLLTLSTFSVALAQGVYGQAPGSARSSKGEAANAGGWHFESELDAEFTFTDNVKLAPSDASRGDFVTQISPRLTIFEKGAHTTFVGRLSAPILLYARTGGENNAIRPEVILSGNADHVQRLLYVDGSVLVSQKYFSPFGPRPRDLVSATENRYTAQSYRISPYVKGEGPGGLHYELRDNNIWSDASRAPVATNRGYTNEVVGNLTRDPRPLGWALEYDRTQTRFSGQSPFRTELERGRMLWKPDPQLELSATAGYEDNRYPLLTTSGATYGAGLKWRPTSRTSVDASWEHRFFGASYRVTMDHRTPLSVWTLRATRDITSYPQQLANLGAGDDVATLLDRLFASRVVDAAQRQSLVDQLIRDRGLPPVLSSPLTLYTQQVTLQQSLLATVGLLGVRNSVFVTAYRMRNEPVGGDVSTAVDPLALQNDNTQTGANVIWSYRLTELFTLTTSGDWVRTVSNSETGRSSNTRSVRVVLSAPLSRLTDVYAGARHQRQVSELESGYRETAVFVGIRHLFR